MTIQVSLIQHGLCSHVDARKLEVTAVRIASANGSVMLINSASMLPLNITLSFRAGRLEVPSCHYRFRLSAPLCPLAAVMLATAVPILPISCSV